LHGVFRPASFSMSVSGEKEAKNRLLDYWLKVFHQILSAKIQVNKDNQQG